MAWLTPMNKWRLLTASDPAYEGIRYAALAPGCTNEPHEGTECGCRTFTLWSDCDSYIRSKMS